tara:strand:- start:338 stop:751 length:414 start_codon:yes stop_codon:yes gene_type:complete
MEKTLILYPAIAMMLLTLFLYTKSYLESIKALKKGDIKHSFFKAYKGDAPDIVEVSRQTLKNQFELPVFFYFLITIILVFDAVSQLDIIFGWLFVVSRYLHCYIRLSSNHILHRAKLFRLGLIILIVWWIISIYNIL